MATIGWHCYSSPIPLFGATSSRSASFSFAAEQRGWKSAARQGEVSCEQEYTAAMMVEESRIPQVDIFHTCRAASREALLLRELICGEPVFPTTASRFV